MGVCAHSYMKHIWGINLLGSITYSTLFLVQGSIHRCSLINLQYKYLGNPCLVNCSFWSDHDPWVVSKSRQKVLLNAHECQILLWTITSPNIFLEFVPLNANNLTIPIHCQISPPGSQDREENRVEGHTRQLDGRYILGTSSNQLAVQVKMEFPLQPVEGTSNPQKGLQQYPSPMNAVKSWSDILRPLFGDFMYCTTSQLHIFQSYAHGWSRVTQSLIGDKCNNQ